jgi:hypothetical protein
MQGRRAEPSDATGEAAMHLIAARRGIALELPKQVGGYEER